MARFLILETLYLGSSKTLPYVWKKYHKNEQHLCYVKHNSTKLSQNVNLINIHILIYRYARYNCKLWKALWFHRVFWVFSYIIDEHSRLKCCIFTKLSHIVCLINVHILISQYTKHDCSLWKVLLFNCFFYMFETL